MSSQNTTFEVDMLNSEMTELDFKINELKEQIKIMKNNELMRIIKGKSYHKGVLQSKYLVKIFKFT